MHNLRVLVVEDNNDDRILVVRALEGKVSTLDVTSSVEEAMPRLSSWRYDVIVADLSRPPGFSGFDLLKIIAGSIDAAFIVLLDDEDEEVEQAVALGAVRVGKELDGRMAGLVAALEQIAARKEAGQ
ncbi:MAG: response regulator [bacterium]|nr:response regulator [bacterium]